MIDYIDSTCCLYVKHVDRTLSCDVPLSLASFSSLFLSGLSSSSTVLVHSEKGQVYLYSTFKTTRLDQSASHAANNKTSGRKLKAREYKCVLRKYFWAVLIRNGKTFRDSGKQKIPDISIFKSWILE